MIVTGGAGFIGSNFIHEVLFHYPDYEVINVDCLTYAGNLENHKEIESHSGYSFKNIDICDKENLKDLFSEKTINYVVHFAAESHVDRSIKNPAVFLQTNVMGTFNLLQSALESWQNNRTAMKENRFLHVSTDEVYGSLGSEGLFTEETPYQPNSPYAASKASSDHVVRSYFHTFGLPAIVSNCSNNYGPYQFPEKLIPLIINNIRSKKPLPIYGDGLNIRDWLYVKDHCLGLMTVLEKGKPGECYNIGGSNEWSNIDIVKLICSLMDKKLDRTNKEASENLITYVEDRLGHDRRYAIDASKISRELGWTPAETFQTGIQKTLDWYMDNLDWLDHVTSGSYQKYYDNMYRVNS